MFNPGVHDARNFFFDTYYKGNNNLELTALEKLAFSSMLEHPEYNKVFGNKAKYLDFNWEPNAGVTNPFLHLSLHLAILEQLSINQPFGVKELYTKLCASSLNEHAAQHSMMECLVSTIWQTRNFKHEPDLNAYLACLHEKLGKE